MANKFKCKDCRHSFSLNSGSEEKCPKCKSDNIEPVSNVFAVIGKIAIFIIMAGIGFFVTDALITEDRNDSTMDSKRSNIVGTDNKNITNKNAKQETEEITKKDTDDTKVEKTKTEPLVPFDAVFSVFDKNLSENGFEFSVEVLAEYDSEVKHYALYLKEDDSKPISISSNGKFKNNGYPAADGKYYIKAIYENGNQTNMASIDGFMKPAKNEPKQVSKMLKEELQDLINKSLGSNLEDTDWFEGNNSDRRLNNNVSVKTKEGREYNTISDMMSDYSFEYMNGDIKVVVVDVSYNESNGKLISFVIDVVKNE